LCAAGKAFVKLRPAENMHSLGGQLVFPISTKSLI